ncbi:MAG: hypothetical protein JNL74_21395, partial [Fibrobacteres bacterium]|nr:hypothetical protein [Fibrobacterota bacterium]
MIKTRITLMALLLGAVSIFALTGPVTSNGFDHYVYWNSADSSFYHVNQRGASADTHLVHRYQGFMSPNDITIAKIGDVGFIPDTAYYRNAYNEDYVRYIFRNDTQIVIDTLEYYTSAPGGNIILYDTLLAIHVGAMGDPANPPTVIRTFNYLADGDYVRLNGKIVQIVKTEYETVRNISWPRDSSALRVWVKASECPKGTNISFNATDEDLTCYKTFSQNTLAKYSLIKDPYQKSKLYFFYISDSGRIISQVTWDNGLTWEEMYEATKNAVLTSTSDQSRSNLNVSINGAGVISISWSGVGTTSTIINVPGATLDTVIMYVRPTGLAASDQQFTTITDVSTFKSMMTPSTAFTSIDRCLNQIIMLENGIPHSELRNYPTSDTAMGNTRAVLTRFYNIRMLPGKYRTNWGDLARSSYRVVPWNIVYSPGWERGIKVESHYSSPESLCVVELQLGDYENNFNNGQASLNGNNFIRVWNRYAIGGGGWRPHYNVERWYPVLSHVEVKGLKFTAIPHTKETSSGATVVTTGSTSDINGLRFINNLFYSMDSTDYTTVGRRYLSHMFYCGGIASSSSIDNTVFIGNIFHRFARFTTQGKRMNQMTYSGGMMYFNNTLFRWRNGISNYWSHNGLYAKVTYINNIADSASTPYSGYETRNAGYLLNDSSKNIFAINNTFMPYWLDTIPANMAFMKVKEASPAATGGSDVITLDSLWKSDYYGVKSSGSRHIGACVPPPSNPLGLQLSMDTVYTPGVRTIKVKILNKGALAGNIDTIRIFRDTASYIRNPYSASNAAYTRATSPDSYYSANVPLTYYYFTVAVGVKQDNGNVSWSNIDPVANGAMIMLPDAFPPQLGFSISDLLNGTYV